MVINFRLTVVFFSFKFLLQVFNCVYFYCFPKNFNNMAEGEAPTEQKKVVHIYPLVKESDMSEDMRNEAIELIVTACEKYAANNEMAANLIKEQLDKKFGPSWHVLVGEGFGFDISYEVNTLLYLFFGGNTGICIWKC